MLDRRTDHILSLFARFRVVWKASKFCGQACRLELRLWAWRTMHGSMYRHKQCGRAWHKTILLISANWTQGVPCVPGNELACILHHWYLCFITNTGLVVPPDIRRHYQAMCCHAYHITGTYIQGRRQGKSLGGAKEPWGSGGSAPSGGPGCRVPWWGSGGKAPLSWSLFSAKIVIEALPEYVFPC